VTLVVESFEGEPRRRPRTIEVTGTVRSKDGSDHERRCSLPAPTGSIDDEFNDRSSRTRLIPLSVNWASVGQERVLPPRQRH